MNEDIITLRERMLINHIKQLQKTLDTISCDLHDDLYLLVEQTIKNSKEIIKIAEGAS